MTAAHKNPLRKVIADRNKPVRLFARDEEDLTIISAILQDAVTRLSDLTFQSRQHRFAGLFNRYRWEDGDNASSGQRVRTGIHFNGVLNVQTRNLPVENREAVLALLAVRAETDGNGGAAITLEFAGGGSIRLDAECVECELADLTAPWAAQGRPEHPISDAE